jgi:hypothetical protein
LKISQSLPSRVTIFQVGIFFLQDPRPRHDILRSLAKTNRLPFGQNSDCYSKDHLALTHVTTVVAYQFSWRKTDELINFHVSGLVGRDY